MNTGVSLAYSLALCSSGVLTTMMFCTGLGQTVSCMAFSFLIPVPVRMADISIRASVLAMFKPPRGLMIILMSSRGITDGMRAAFVASETTFFTVRVVNHVVLLAARFANSGVGAMVKHVSCLAALVAHQSSRFVRVDLDQLVMIPDNSGKLGCGKCDVWVMSPKILFIVRKGP